MAKNTKRKQTKKPEPGCQLVIQERLRALDDAASSAVESIADHVDLTDAASTVVTGMFMSAAGIVWHVTTFSEAEFVETARRCYQRLAEGHAHCERGNGEVDGSVPHHHARENLN